MHILIAPQEFKGSLTAAQAAAAMAAGISAALPRARVTQLPLSDGGPGLVDAMLAAMGGSRFEVSVADPLMRPVPATFGLLPDAAAVIEMAAASGLVLLTPQERDPLAATTYGTGQLIAAALDHSPPEIVLGVGGSATVDGGAGAAQALGVHLLDDNGRELPPGGAALVHLAHIDAAGLDPRLQATRVRIACDVASPLTGATGAAAVFGPQKGASPEDVIVLEAALSHFASVLVRAAGIDVTTIPGAGAAGGLPASLVALAGATLEPGFDLVADVTGLDAIVAQTDLVITGEGRLDAQTAFGKTASGVARLARRHGKPVGIIAGSIDPSYLTHGLEFDDTAELVQPGVDIQEALVRAPLLLREAAKRMVLRMAA